MHTPPLTLQEQIQHKRDCVERFVPVVERRSFSLVTPLEPTSFSVWWKCFPGASYTAFYYFQPSQTWLKRSTGDFGILWRHTSNCPYCGRRIYRLIYRTLCRMFWFGGVLNGVKLTPVLFRCADAACRGTCWIKAFEWLKPSWRKWRKYHRKWPISYVGIRTDWLFITERAMRGLRNIYMRILLRSFLRWIPSLVGMVSNTILFWIVHTV